MKARISLSLLALCLVLSLAVGCTKGASDAQISSQVQAKIAADGTIQSKQIIVQSADGVVTLSGNVATETERASAANDAATVSGVKTVINNLQVQPQAAQAVPPAATPTPARTSRQSAATAAGRTTTPSPMANTSTLAQAPPPLPPARPVTVTVPDGTEISVRLIDPLDSEKNQAGDIFRATLDQPIMVLNEIVIPSGADVEGRVIEAKNAAHFSGSSSLTVALTRLMVNGKTYNLQTDQWSKQGTGRGKNTAVKVGGGAALGAIIGGIAGGGKGAAIGAGVGAGAGTGVQAVTRGQQTRLASEAVLNFRLQNSLTVTPTSHRNRN